MSTLDVIRDLERMRKSIQLKKTITLGLFAFVFLGYFVYATNPAGPLIFIGAMVGMVVLSLKANKETKE